MMLLHLTKSLRNLSTLSTILICWTVTGTTAHADTPPVRNFPPTPASYRQVDTLVEANLQNQVLKMWFPRAMDEQNGGFHENYADDWTVLPDSQRSIVYQSRLTWLSAEAVVRYPKGAGVFGACAEHGLDFLANKQWDHQDGGPFWAVDPSGQPTTRYGGEKHAYGIAFSLYAESAAYTSTHDPKALALAKATFHWLDQHAHDGAHGGYYEALTREGSPILSPPSDDNGSDAIGTPYGEKTMNTHIHLLEAFTALYKIWPDPTVKSRLTELFKIIRDTVTSPDGYLIQYFKPDWTPIPSTDSFGHDIETAYLLNEAAEALGMAGDVKTLSTERLLVDHALHYGWDGQYGGLYDQGAIDGVPTITNKVWWEQAECLNSLLLMHARYGHLDRRYWTDFLTEWDFIQRYQVDGVHGGWYNTVNREGAAPQGSQKSDGWTECYHQGRALLNVSARLEEMAHAK